MVVWVGNAAKGLDDGDEVCFGPLRVFDAKEHQREISGEILRIRCGSRLRCWSSHGGAAAVSGSLSHLNEEVIVTVSQSKQPKSSSLKTSLGFNHQVDKGKRRLDKQIYPILGLMEKCIEEMEKEADLKEVKFPRTRVQAEQPFNIY